MRSKHRASLAVLAVAAAAGIGGAVTVAVGGGSPEPSALATRGELLSTGAGLGQGLALDGSRLVESEAARQRELAELGDGEEVIAALTAALVPVATVSADGGPIVYSTWRQLAVLDYDAPGLGLEVGDPVGVPSVRAYDREKGVDALLAGGAYAPAVSKAGAIAYAVGDEETVRQNVDYPSRVVVRDSLEGEPREWTSKSARYFPYAWVGDSLLVYQALQDSEATDLYVYRGPDDATLLAPEAYVIAVSPDGSRVLASVGRRMLEVLRVADGAIESSLALDGGAVAVDSPPTPHALMYSGSWWGDMGTGAPPPQAWRRGVCMILVTASPAAASSFFTYQRTSLINSTFYVQSGYASMGVRGGSGSGANQCQTNNWISLGTYSVPFRNDNYAGSLIQGRVWCLSDYQCSNGVRRTELFVHSEETSSQGQSCPTPGDDPFCWEGNDDTGTLTIR